MMNIVSSNYHLHAVLGVAFFTLWALRRLNSRRLKLPPGPTSFPLLGNLLQIPTVKPYLTYTQWRERYGDMIYMNALGMNILVLNSLEPCVDLMEKRSARYSDRPPMVMLTDLMGWGYFLNFMPYSSRWRSHRRLLHTTFNEHKVRDYVPAQTRATHALLRRLLNDPDKFMEHFRFSFSDSIMEVVYDIKVDEHNDKYVRQAEEAVSLISSLANVGIFMVDLFPPLKHIPSWFPGADFKRKAQEWHPMSVAFKTAPFEHVRQNMELGIAGPSVLTAMLEASTKEKRDMDESFTDSPEDVAKNTAAVVYAAGADTTVASTQALFLALVEHPEVLVAAQAELDAVVGNDRLPTFEDAPKLPYISALIKELLRWHNVTPLGFPHVASEDDEYNGYFIPKGTMILPNVWSILHDPSIFTDPFKFDPMRWLDVTPAGKVLHNRLPDPHFVAFGFGRRVCPGRFFANNSLFIIISTVLACFEVGPPKDESGNPVPVKVEFTDGLLSYPAPYKVTLNPRSERAACLIKETEL